MVYFSIERTSRVTGTALAVAQINSSTGLVTQIMPRCNLLSYWLLVCFVVCLTFLCMINALIFSIGAKRKLVVDSLALSVTCIITSANHIKRFVPKCNWVITFWNICVVACLFYWSIKLVLTGRSMWHEHIVDVTWFYKLIICQGAQMNVQLTKKVRSSSDNMYNDHIICLMSEPLGCYNECTCTTSFKFAGL